MPPSSRSSWSLSCIRPGIARLEFSKHCDSDIIIGEAESLRLDRPTTRLGPALTKSQYQDRSGRGTLQGLWLLLRQEEGQSS